MTDSIYIDGQRREIDGYSDIDLSFKPNPNTKDLMIKRNIASIRQNIGLIFIDSGLPFHPETDSQIGSELFELWDPLDKRHIIRKIEYQIENYEPRIKVHNILVDFDNVKQALSVKVDFEYLGETATVTFDVLVHSAH